MVSIPFSGYKEVDNRIHMHGRQGYKDTKVGLHYLFQQIITVIIHKLIVHQILNKQSCISVVNNIKIKIKNGLTKSLTSKNE